MDDNTSGRFRTGVSSPVTTVPPLRMAVTLSMWAGAEAVGAENRQEL